MELGGRSKKKKRLIVNNIEIHTSVQVEEITIRIESY
jgi:hypothetical protein